MTRLNWRAVLLTALDILGLLLLALAWAIAWAATT